MNKTKKNIIKNSNKTPKNIIKNFEDPDNEREYLTIHNYKILDQQLN